MKRIFAMLILSVSSVSGTAKPQSRERIPEVTIEKPMSFWMAQKIDLSKKILESLTKQDFAALETDANQLRTLGKIEGFVRRQDEAYRRYQQQFDSALLDVANQARARNVEGAALAFNQLTTSCVVCHKRLRQQSEQTKLAPASEKP